MPKNNYLQLIFAIKEARRRLELNEISQNEAALIFKNLKRDFERINKLVDSKEFNDYCKFLFL